MKNCTDCKHAVWHITAAGKRHPSGDGACDYKWRLPALPASMYWTGSDSALTPSGGHINRRRELKEHCVYFERKVAS